MSSSSINCDFHYIIVPESQTSFPMSCARKIFRAHFYLLNPRGPRKRYSNNFQWRYFLEVFWPVSTFRAHLTKHEVRPGSSVITVKVTITTTFEGKRKIIIEQFIRRYGTVFRLFFATEVSNKALQETEISKNFRGCMPPDPPRIVSSLWPPPH